MEDKTVLYFGALLHDVGKIVYRGVSARDSHSRLGARFVGEEVAALLEEQAIEIVFPHLQAAQRPLIGRHVGKHIIDRSAGNLAAVGRLPPLPRRPAPRRR